MITAVCLNPAVDRSVVLERLLPGETNRILEEQRSLGGKGINCARMLAMQGLEARTVALMPEEDLAFARTALTPHGVALDAVMVPGRLRENLKIFSQETREITEVNASGMLMPVEALEKAFERILLCARDSAWLLLSGSLPPGCGSDFYARVIRAVRQNVPGCNIALDAEGEAFRMAAMEGPDLVKPNQREMSFFLEQPAEDVDSMERGAARLLTQGVGAVLASMGSAGSMYLSRSQRLGAPAIPVNVRSTVGAGDAMLSGWVAAAATGSDERSAFARAIACATASVAGKAAEYTSFVPQAQALIAVQPPAL